MAIEVTNDALQLFGAAGYSRNLPLERMGRDARMFTIAGGTAQILRTGGGRAPPRPQAAADAQRLLRRIGPAVIGALSWLHPSFTVREVSLYVPNSPCIVTDYRTDPILRRALAHWQRLRGGRAMPSRRDFDPAEVPALLPHLQLVDIVAGRYRYRLVGTELVETFGRDYTGQFPDEMFPGPRGRVICQVFNAVRDARQPMFLRSRYITAKNLELVANRLYLPLSEDGREVNMILGVLTFDFGSVGPVAGAWGSAALAPEGSHLELVRLED